MVMRLLKRYLKVTLLFSGVAFMCIWTLNHRIEDILRKDIALDLERRHHMKNISVKKHFVDKKDIKKEWLNTEDILPLLQAPRANKPIKMEEILHTEETQNRPSEPRPKEEKQEQLRKLAGHRVPMQRRMKQKEESKKEVVKQEAPVQIPIPAKKEGPGIINTFKICWW